MTSLKSRPASWRLWIAAASIASCVLLYCATLAGLAVLINFVATPPDRGGPFGPGAGSGAPAAAIDRPADLSPAHETLRVLQSVRLPPLDPYEHVCEMWSECDVPHTIHAPAKPYALGDRRLFWIGGSGDEEDRKVAATLRRMSAHAYLWLQEDVEVPEEQLEALITTFEDRIYPTNRDLFGSEWTPGIDNDEHVYVLVVRGLDPSLGGYFSTANEFHPDLYGTSNGAELVFISLDALDRGWLEASPILAHEFEHVIHWNLDHDEATWLNEGMAELAVKMNDFDPGAGSYAFARSPDISLHDWVRPEHDPSLSSRHYGKAYLFMLYFLDRFGEAAVRDLAADTQNSLASVDHVLKELGQTDAITGRPISADDLVLDWMLATYLGNASVADGRFAYGQSGDVPRAANAHRIKVCPAPPLEGSVSQYGADYIEITCPGDHTLEFTGSTLVDVVPADPHAGKYAFWSNTGDAAITSLTREFDLKNLSGAIELTYWTWFDIEEDADSLVVYVSDDGDPWHAVRTGFCSAAETFTASYDCAYKGRSGDETDARWIKDSVDLAAYAGRRVKIRFEYTSWTADTGYGFLLDDIALPKLDYAEGFENGHGGWRSDGFVRLQNALPQTYRLALIHKGLFASTVDYLAVSEDQTTELQISLAPWERVVLLVTGTQRLTRLPSGYSIQIK